MVRALILLAILLAVIAGVAALAALPLQSLEWPGAPSTAEPAPVPLVSNQAGKSNKANAGVAVLRGYDIVQTETAPITTAIAAAARAAMEMPLPPPPEPPREEKPTNILLNEAQIASLRDRLQLTPAQAQHWPAVEAALRAYVTRQYEAQRRRPTATIAADPDSPELRNLQVAAAPFFASLDDRQKQQIRLLAGMIGLGSVISQL